MTLSESCLYCKIGFHGYVIHLRIRCAGFQLERHTLAFTAALSSAPGLQQATSPDSIFVRHQCLSCAARPSYLCQRLSPSRTILTRIWNDLPRYQFGAPVARQQRKGSACSCYHCASLRHLYSGPHITISRKEPEPPMGPSVTRASPP